MRFFSRVTFICNVCFIISVVLRLVELNRRSAGNLNNAIKFQPLEATLVILGYGAIFLNAIYFIFGMYLLLARKMKLIPAWVVIFNLIVFPVQVYYFFFFS